MRRIALAMGGLLSVHAHSQDDAWERIRDGILNHPAMAHERRKSQERWAEVEFAGRPGVGRLELELENFGGSGGASGFGGSSLGLWAGADYRLGEVGQREKDLARTEAQLQGLDTLRARIEWLARARSVWDQWREQRWMVRLLDTLATQADEVVERLEKGRKAGRVAPWEVSMARAESGRLRTIAQARRGKAKALWSRLSAWGGGEEPLSLADPVVDTSRIVAGRGLDSLFLEAERSRARSLAALSQAQDRPVLSGAVGLLREQSTGDVGVGLRVSLPLPPWKREGVEAARARHEAAALERSIALATRERLIRRGDLHGERENALSELRSWETRVLPARELGLEQIETSHAAGAVDALAVWTVRKELWEARIERLEKTIRVLEIQRELDNLEGTEP